MKISFKPIVRLDRQKKDGTFPVYLRIGLKSKYAFMSIGISVTKKQLSKKNEIKDSIILEDVSIIIKTYRDRLINVELQNIKEVLNFLQKEETPKEIDFLKYFKNKVDVMFDNKHASRSIYGTSFNHLIGFAETSVLYPKDITPKFLQSFEVYLKKSGVGDRGVNLYLTSLRASYNSMIDDYEHLGYSFPYPFRKYKIPSHKPRKTIALTKNELCMIINEKLPTGSKMQDRVNKTTDLGRDVFIISLLTLGANTVDLFNLKESINGRLEYERSKTKDKRGDDAFISIKIEEELKPYIEKYKGKNSYLFSFRDKYSNKEQFNRAVNSGLKKIIKIINENGGSLSESIRYYDARRTVASIMYNKLGISKDYVAMCLNHVNSDHKTTDFYIEKDFSILDKSNRKFIDWLFT